MSRVRPTVLQATVLLLLLLVGCGTTKAAQRKSDQEKIARSLALAKSQMIGGPATKGELKRQVVAVLQSSTPESLEHPTLAASLISLESEPPIVLFWWVEKTPTIDGVILRWPGTPEGTMLRIPKELADWSSREYRDLVLFSSGVPLQTYLDAGLVIPIEGVEAALSKDGKTVSSFI